MRTRFYFILVVFLVAALGWAGWQMVRPWPPEPVYYGKPLNYWLGIEPLPGFLRLQSKPDANAVSFLIAALKQDSWAGAAFYRKWLWPKLYPKLPPSARKHLPFPRSSKRIFRQNAATLLGDMGSTASRSIPALIKALEVDEDVSVRACAAWALGKAGTGNESAVAALTQASSKDTSARVRIIALAALGKFGRTDQAAVAAVFDSLSLSDKVGLLRGDWERARTPLLLTSLMKIVQSSAGAFGPGLELLDWALVRAYDLDPKTVRPLVLAEMRAPHLSANYPAWEKIQALAALPEATLPEMDEAFASQLTRDTGFDRLDLSLRLISRYATKAIEPQVKAYFEPAAGRWACALQASMLAYFLRVDEAYGTEAFAKSLTSRQTGCWQYLFTEVGQQVWTPALERLAVKALGDEDATVREDAAKALMKFATEAAAKAGVKKTLP
jgi:HEAT repeat protein